MSMRFFRQIENVSIASLTPPIWPTVQMSVGANIEAIVRYYRQLRLPCRSDHPIVALLLNLYVSPNQSLEGFTSKIREISLEVASLMKMTSMYSKGQPHPGKFYSKNMPEFYLATNEWFDPVLVDRYWRQAICVEPLIHPRSDFKLTIPVGDKQSNEYGLTVIKINVPKLAVQYRAWLREEGITKDGTQDVTRFVGGYVLPNMLPRQAEISLFNQISNCFYGRGLEVDKLSSFRHPIALANHDRVHKEGIERVVENLRKTPGRFSYLLSAMPGLRLKNLHHALTIPKIPTNIQVSWLVLSSRIRVLRTLMDMAGEDAKSQNQYLFNDLERNLRLYETRAMILENIGPAYQSEVLTDINALEEMGGI